MRSMRIRCLSWCSGLGLLTLAVVPVSAKCPVCRSCCAEKTTTCAMAPCDQADHASGADGLIAPKSNGAVTNDKHSLLILNCPANARVTIDGRVTHASGAMRQYRLTFRDENYTGRIEVRLRDNEENVTYDFDTTLHCRHHGREVLTVTQQQMRATRDKPEKKPEDEASRCCEKPVSAKPSNTEPPSTLQQTIAQQKKLLDLEQARMEGLEKDLTAKRTRWEAAVGIRKKLQDAHRVKITEVDLAKNDSAVVQASKKLELVKIETEEQRATEVEGTAWADVVGAQNLVNAAQGQVRELTGKLNHWKLIQSIAQQTKVVEQATSEMQRLRGLVNTKAARLKFTADTKDAALKAAKDPQIATAMLLEIEQKATDELNEARKELSTAEERLRDEQARLDAVKLGTLKLD